MEAMLQLVLDCRSCNAEIAATCQMASWELEGATGEVSLSSPRWRDCGLKVRLRLQKERSGDAKHVK